MKVVSTTYAEGEVLLVHAEGDGYIIAHTITVHGATPIEAVKAYLRELEGIHRQATRASHALADEQSKERSS